METKYYVYGLYEEGNNLPFYIGKGSGRRLERYSLDNNEKYGHMLHCKFKNLKSKNKKLVKKILFDELNEETALTKERELIRHYGKRCDGSGILFNFSDGGNQPPSLYDLKRIYGDDKIKEIMSKRSITYYENLYIKNFTDILEVERLLNSDYLIKDIATHLGKDRNTISKWIDRYNLKYDDTKKRLLEIERLQSFKKINSQRIQKTSKKYVVVFPDETEIEILKLVTFCKEYKLDYRNLRNTYKRYKNDGSPCKYKGYWIKNVIEPLI